MPRFGFIVALLAALVVVAFSYAAAAETDTHGVAIPTVVHGSGPTLQVCTPTGSWWSGSGHPGTATASRVGSYGAAYCTPRTEGGPRPSLIPEEVKEAAALIESSVFFNHDSFTLTDDAIEAISVVAAWFEEEPNARLTIAGHTDATGTEEYNASLSESRARTVAAFLTEHGVDSERIDVEWFGESFLLVDTLKRNPENRRVVITPTLDAPVFHDPTE